jgi:dsRNA-specific ribonuclease
MISVQRWIEERLGHAPKDVALFERALTHSSYGDEHYERLEYLGDRVLGLAMAAWLYELFPDEPEGKLSRRLNALVAGETCAEVGRELGVGDQMRLGKQAREDGASDSDNVLGDIVEAVIGALYLERGFEEAARFVRQAWGDRVSTHDKPPSIRSPSCRNGPRRTTASRRSTSSPSAPGRTMRRASWSRSRFAASAAPARKGRPSRRPRPRRRPS